jgi:hypothetical protein
MVYKSLSHWKALENMITNVCHPNVYTKHFLVQPNILPMSFGASVMNEGSFAQVSCIVPEGDEPLSISWSFHGTEVTTDPGIITSPLGTRGSSLMIPTVGHRHSGDYTCKAKNSAGVASETVQLMVNGQFW